VLQQITVASAGFLLPGGIPAGWRERADRRSCATGLPATEGRDREPVITATGSLSPGCHRAPRHPVGRMRPGSLGLTDRVATGPVPLSWPRAVHRRESGGFVGSAGSGDLSGLVRSPNRDSFGRALSVGIRRYGVKRPNIRRHGRQHPRRPNRELELESRCDCTVRRGCFFGWR
jgi:hypothetical protein